MTNSLRESPSEDFERFLSHTDCNQRYETLEKYVHVLEDKIDSICVSLINKEQFNQLLETQVQTLEREIDLINLSLTNTEKTIRFLETKVNNTKVEIDENRNEKELFKQVSLGNWVLVRKILETPNLNINYQDKLHGDTILHVCVRSYDFNYCPYEHIPTDVFKLIINYKGFIPCIENYQEILSCFKNTSHKKKFETNNCCFDNLHKRAQRK